MSSVAARELAALRAEVALLRARIEVLEIARGPRDDAERAALTVIATCGQRRFTARELWRHARHDERLAEAFLAADCTSVRELGLLLRRLAASPPQHGYRLVRYARIAAGVEWAVEPV